MSPQTHTWLFKNATGGSRPPSSARNARHVCYGGVGVGWLDAGPSGNVCEGPVARGYVPAQEIPTRAPATVSVSDLELVNNQLEVVPLTQDSQPSPTRSRTQLGFLSHQIAPGPPERPPNELPWLQTL